MAEFKVTNDNFEDEVVLSELPVLVDFWAPWCGPCSMIAPEVEAFAEENEGKIKVGKLNVDEEPLLSIQYKVMSIPTLLLFRDGQMIGRFVGYRDREEIAEIVEETLATK